MAIINSVDSSGYLQNDTMSLNGTTIDTNSGSKSAGTQRVVIATDQPQLTNPLKIVGNTGGTMDAAGQNASSPANELLIAGQFNTTPTTITSGNVSPLQLDSAGNLLVNIKAGAGSGGTALADNAAFTAGTTQGTPAFGFYHSTIDTVTDGHSASLAIDSKRNLFNVIRDAAGNARGANVTASNELLVNINNTPTVTANAGSGTFNIQSNASVNLNQIAGSAVSTAASGVLLVGAADGAGNKLTTNSTTYTSKFALDGNLLGTLGTAFSTAGKVDVKGADGDVFVRQATASNLNATVVGTGTFAVQATQSGNWTNRIVGNAGATLDAIVGAGTAPANMLVTGSVYNISAPAPTNGQSMAVQADQAGNIRTFPGIALTTLSAWNSSTSLNATQNIFTNSGTPAVLVQLDQTTTITAGAITFEATYDGTNWVTVSANTVLDPTSITYAQISLPYTLQASTNKAFIISSNGWQGLRIKLSTQITGTGAVTPYYALLAYDPIESVIAYSPTASNFNVTVGGSLPSGSNTIGAVTQASGPWTSNLTQIAGSSIGTAASGIMKVGLTDGSGNAINSTSNALNVNMTNSTVAVTESGTWTVQPGNTPNTTPWLVTPTPTSNTGWNFKYNAGGFNATKVQIKGSAGTFGGYLNLMNPNTATSYVQIFNKTSSNVTVGTTTPDFVIVLPGVASASATGAGANVELGNGIAMSTGITVAVTTTETGSTNPTNNVWATFLYV